MGLMDKVKSMFGGGSADKAKGKYSDPLQKADDGVAKAVDKLDGDK